MYFEQNSEGTQLLAAAASVYEQGFTPPDSNWDHGHNLWTRGRIGGMEDTVNEPLLFYSYFCQFYPRIITYWYRVLHREFPKPEYLALPEIKERDRDFITYYNNLWRRKPLWATK